MAWVLLPTVQDRPAPPPATFFFPAELRQICSLGDPTGAAEPMDAMEEAFLVSWGVDFVYLMFMILFISWSLFDSVCFLFYCWLTDVGIINYQ